eukprot:jgi/Mesen1/5218/ME000258S04302
MAAEEVEIRREDVQVAESQSAESDGRDDARSSAPRSSEDHKQGMPNGSGKAEEEEEEEEEDLSAAALMRGHMRRFAKARKRSREEWLTRIARYKHRLAILDSFNGDATPPGDSLAMPSG